MRRIAAIVVILVAAGAVWLLWSAPIWAPGPGAARSAFSSPENVRSFVEGFGGWAPAVYFALQVSQVIVAPVPGPLLTLAGAAVFGTGTGLLLNVGAVLLGSLLGFLLARRWGRPLVVRLVGPEAFERYAGLVGARGGFWLCLALLFPFLPDDALCLLAGMSALPVRRFLVIIVLGRLPGTVFTTVAASELVAQPLGVWAVVGAVSALGVALTIRYGGRMEGWLTGRARVGA